jgi:nucleoside-diphosphate-sugar epimerase
MKAIVTGAGLVGIHVAHAFGLAGYEVILVSRSGIPSMARQYLSSGGKVHGETIDICNMELLRNIWPPDTVDCIVHTAAITGEAAAKKRPNDIIGTNVMGTANLLEVARESRVRRFIYVSSSAVYGKRADMKPIIEDEVNPGGLYGETKWMGEVLGKRYADLYGMDFMVVRISSVYGPYQRSLPTRGLVGYPLIEYLVKKALKSEPVTLDAGGQYFRGYTYVKDVAQGILLLASIKGPLRHSTYNIASGQAYSVDELARSIELLVPGSKINVGKGQWDNDPFQQGSLRGPLDITRARQELNFLPEYDLRKGLGEFIDWVKTVS